MSQITLVSNAIGLANALKTANGGDKILLSPGDYGDVALKYISPSGMVTVSSADATKDAVFGSLKLTAVSNVTFNDIDVSHPLKPGEPDFAAAAVINQSKNIVFQGIDFSGSQNGTPYDDGNGIMISGSSGIKVTGSTFREFNNAAIFSRSQDVTFAGNDVRDVREGVNIAQIDGGVFERNFLTDIRGDATKGDHSDAFQVHAGGTMGVSSNLTFTSNIIMGDNNQGIFIRSEKAQTKGLEHSNIAVTNNYIETNFRNAISVNDTNGVIVSGNTVRDAVGDGLVPGITTSNLNDGIVSLNVSPLMLQRAGDLFESHSLTISDNIDLWDTKQKLGVNESDIFSDPAGTGDSNFSALGVRLGSVADSIGAGFRPVSGIGSDPATPPAQVAASMQIADNQKTFSPVISAPPVGTANVEVLAPEARAGGSEAAIGVGASPVFNNKHGVVPLQMTATTQVPQFDKKFAEAIFAAPPGTGDIDLSGAAARAANAVETTRMAFSPSSGMSDIFAQGSDHPAVMVHMPQFDAMLGAVVLL